MHTSGRLNGGLLGQAEKWGENRDGGHRCVSETTRAVGMEVELQPPLYSLDHKRGRSSFTPGKVITHITSLSWQNQVELVGKL